MTFKAFIQSARVTETPRGEFIADVKTLINAGVFPPVDSWSELYRFLIRRGSSADVATARAVWQQFKAKISEAA